ncbi:hypothetical protein D3C80_1815260 [compost metagenome]
MLCGLSNARWLAACNSASATATSLPRTSARLRKVVSSRENSGVPLSTGWLGRTWICSITPSMGELMICAWRETISAGARAVCRTGNNSKAPSTIRPNNSCRRLGRQRLKRRCPVNAAQQ